MLLTKIQEAVQQKRWDITVNMTNINTQGPSKIQPQIKLRTGIVGIERSLQEKHKATDESISSAFQDLSKLMVMAKDMVKFYTIIKKSFVSNKLF